MQTDAAPLANVAAVSPAHSACTGVQAGKQQQSLQQASRFGVSLGHLTCRPAAPADMLSLGPLWDRDARQSGCALDSTAAPCSAGTSCLACSCATGMSLRSWATRTVLWSRTAAMRSKSAGEAPDVVRSSVPAVPVLLQLSCAWQSLQRVVHTSLRSAQQLLPGRQASRP